TNWTFPFVLKPGDDLPTAGGYGVMICYDDEDLIKAKSRIEQAKDETDTIIIEQKIQEIANYCVQFACEKEGDIHYIGTQSKLQTNMDIIVVIKMYMMCLNQSFKQAKKSWK